MPVVCCLPVSSPFTRMNDSDSNATASSMSLLEEKPLLYGPDFALRPAGAQFAGLVVDYEHNLSFITVHGSGHMVPQFRPRVAYHMLDKVLSGEKFAPPLPTDAQIEAMTDAEFDSALDAWTKTAKVVS